MVIWMETAYSDLIKVKRDMVRHMLYLIQEAEVPQRALLMMEDMRL